jgi:hypothetical protein
VLLSDQRYFITRARLALGWWHNAYGPKSRGIPIASGSLQRCIQACERHAAGELHARTKRAVRSGTVGPRRRRGAPALELLAQS